MAQRKITWQLSRRRRRFWRYVSPHRRGVGVAILAALLAMFYGYWSLTNGRRVRNEAERYLQTLTGGKVRIGSASFSFFGGVRLQDVSLYLPDSDSPDPFFRARQVILRHEPWQLLMGRLRAVEITCVEPTVTWEQEADTGGGAKTPADAARGFDWQGPLPTVHLHQARLRIVEKVGNLRQPRPELPLMEMSLVPEGPPGLYTVTFKQQSSGPGPPAEGQFVLDIATSRIVRTNAGVILPITNLARALPSPYSDWLSRYGVRGNFLIQARQDAADSSPVYEVELKDFALKLPPEEGSLDLVNVSGTLVFEQGGLTIHDVVGQVSQAGGARFEMSGWCSGYERDSAFHASLAIAHVSPPDPSAVTGRAAEILQEFHKVYQPKGQISVSAQMDRLADGTIRYWGQATPEGMSARFLYFPYQLDDLRGTLNFSDTGVELIGLTARHGDARIAVDGKLGGINGGDSYEMFTRGTDVALDQDLKQALPRYMDEIWANLSPGGRADGEVRVTRAKGEDREHVDVKMILNGHTSMSYFGFPYRVENILGQLRIVGGDVLIDPGNPLRASRGSMACTVTGRVSKVDTSEPDVALDIEARRMPVDDVLLAAIGPQGRAMLTDIRAAGTADLVQATIRQSNGGALVWDVQAHVGDASFRIPAFPYDITGASGALIVQPGRVVIRQMEGKHGQTPVNLSGTVLLTEPMGLDIRAAGRNVPLDDALYSAAPEQAQRIWRQLRPQGSADLDMIFRQGLPGHGDLDYRLVINPRGAKMNYRFFPYPAGELTGTAIVTPGLVVLESIKTSAGDMSATLSGTITSDSRGDLAELSIQAVGVPVDKPLLTAFPRDTVPLLDLVKPGGTCDMQIDRLTMVWPASPPAATRSATTRPLARTEPVTMLPVSMSSAPDRGGVATASSEPADDSDDEPRAAVGAWAVRGKLDLKDAIVDVGFGDHKFTGRFSGSAWQDAAGLGIQVELALDKLAVGPRELTEVRSTIVKSPSGTLIRVKDLSGKMYGGLLAGFAEVRRDKDIECGIKLDFQGINLHDLLNAGVKDPAKKLAAEGLLDGTLKLRGKIGDDASRQADGMLRISKASLSHVPVLTGAPQEPVLPLPGGGYSEGDITYELRGRQMIFHEIYLRGTGPSIVGSGTMDMKTETLKLTFLSDARGKLPRISGLSTVLEGIWREMVEIRVTGTLSKPVMRSVSLRSLQDAVDTLANPKPD